MNIKHMMQCGKVYKVGDVISSVRISAEIGRNVNIAGQTVRQLAKIGAAKRLEKIGTVMQFEVIRNIQDAIDDEFARRKNKKPVRRCTMKTTEAFNPQLIQMFNESIMRVRMQ
ncbi:hypothetical protein HBM99_05620 [Providencia heimbachae]|uniref:hypothetical protein n=1 Tax=Providencia heimbachae TaxID=333962 RepID=UPI0014198981|nr:hypothetical protein [Providencia heimbachae]NIH21837.1 hypothetical protein [Providencia heimbachae]